MSGPPTARSRPAGNRAATRNVQADEANAHGTPVPRQRDSGRADTWHAMATVFRVVGTRGRIRSVIVVGRCPWCSRPHVHTGKPDFVNGRRTASCHAGRYLVHTSVLEGEVAA
jgi:hypothetical protein